MATLLGLIAACGTDGRVTPLPKIEGSDRVEARRATAAGRYEEARRLWSKRRIAAPSDPEGWMGEARVLLEDPSIDRSSFVRELATADLDDRFATGLAMFLEPDSERARVEANFEQRLRDDEDDFWARVFLGELYAEKGETARAHELLAPIAADERFPLCSTRTSVEASLAEAEKATALAGLLRLEAAGLDDYTTTYNIGTLLIDVDEDYEGAAERFAKARSLRPGELDPLLNLASVHLMAGRKDEGRRLLEEAEAEHPDAADVHFNLGVYWADHAREPARAIQHFERYLALDGEWKLRVEGWLKELRAEVGS